MSMRNIFRKMFATAAKSHDEWGQPIKKETIEEHLLEKHLEMERKKKIRKMLDYYQKKHFKEMTSMQMPYHKKFMKKRKRR